MVEDAGVRYRCLVGPITYGLGRGRVRQKLKPDPPLKRETYTKGSKAPSGEGRNKVKSSAQSRQFVSPRSD